MNAAQKIILACGLVLFTALALRPIQFWGSTNWLWLLWTDGQIINLFEYNGTLVLVAVVTISLVALVSSQPKD